MSKIVTVVLKLASDQGGLLTTQQAKRHGISRLSLSRLAEQGMIERVAQGVYSTIEGAMNPHAGLRAAWLSLEPHLFAFERLDAGPQGFSVTHRSAAELHGLGQLIPDKLEFVSTVQKRTRREDVRLRRRSVSDADITLVKGLPCTTVEKTIADLIESNEDLSLVADTFADGAKLNMVDFDHLSRLLEPLAKRNGYQSGHELERSLVDIENLESVLTEAVAEALQTVASSLQLQFPSLVLNSETKRTLKATIITFIEDNSQEITAVLRESVRPIPIDIAIPTHLSK